jgi:hypothetical protein
LTQRIPSPDRTWHDRTGFFGLQTSLTPATIQPEALVNAAKFTAPQAFDSAPAHTFSVANNLLLLKDNSFQPIRYCSHARRSLKCSVRKVGESESILIWLSEIVIPRRQPVRRFTQPGAPLRVAAAPAI